jgi:hypothetical protein
MMRAFWLMRRVARSLVEGVGLIIGVQFLSLMVLAPLLVVPSFLALPMFVVTAFVFRFVILWGFVRVSTPAASDSAGVGSGGFASTEALSTDGAGAPRRPSAADALVHAIPEDDESSRALSFVPTRAEFEWMRSGDPDWLPGRVQPQPGIIARPPSARFRRSR